jgi:sugar transferase (PEP-CTERM system associated)
MIRVFNHYVHRATVLRVLFDTALIFFAILGVVATQVENLRAALPMAGTHVMSLAAGMFVINSASGFYERDYNRSLSQSCARAVLALVLAVPLTFATFGLLPYDFPNHVGVQMAATLGVAAVIVRRVYVAHAATRSRPRTRVLIFGAGSAAKLVGSTINDSDPTVEVVGYLAGPNEQNTVVPAYQLLSGGGTLLDVARRLRVDEIVVALTERRSGSMPMRELLDCKLSGIRVYDVTSHFEKTQGQIRIDFVNAGWLIFGDGFNQSFTRTLVKRLFDIFCALTLILVSGPVMLLAALAIRFESRGPILYRQQRVGLNGSTFDVVKFRSMRVDAEKDGPRWAAQKDDRITRIGAIIRRTRIDELPQLFNVLKGDMSLVGPRPERPYFVEQLTQQIPYFAVRQSVKPGLTGWAQVRYQYGSTIEDSQQKLQFDLYYVKNHTLFLDCVILLETVGVVLTGKGAR